MGWLSKVFGNTGAKIITIAAAIGISALTGGLAAGVFGAAAGAGGFFAAAAGFSGLAASAIGLAGSLLAGGLLTSALLSRGPSDQFAGSNSALVDVLGTRALSSAQTSNSVPWVVGNAYLSGQVFDTVLSTDQQTIWYAIVTSEVGTSQTFNYDLTKTYWGDKRATFDATDQTRIVSLTDNAGTADTKISGNVFMYFYTNGSASGQNTSRTAIDVMSDPAIPVVNRWTANNTMSNASFVIVKIVYNQTAGITGLVTPKFRLTSNVAYQKPGSIWYEYMTNTRFGLGVPPSSVDQASATAWDAYADQEISYMPSGGGVAMLQPRYRLNGVLDTKQSFRSNLDLMMANGDAFFRFDEINNKWQVIPNMPASAVFAFDDTNIVGAFSFSPKTLRESYTEAVISFPDNNILDQQNNVYLTVPNNLLKPNLPPNSLNLTYALTNESVQAQYLANRILEQAQEDLVISFNASYNAAGIQAGDVVTVTNTTYGWTGKLFRVAEVREESSDTLGLYVNVLCMEYNAQVYDNFSITQFTPAPNTNIPDPTFFGSLVIPTVTNPLPTTAVPSFTLNGTIPASGIATRLDFFVSTTNSFTNARLLQSLPYSVSTGYLQGSTVSITVTSLVAGTYYFFTQVGNGIGTSAPSQASIPLTWNPTPASTSSGVAVNPNWIPAVILVPADASNVATTVGQLATLEVYLGTTLLTYSTSATDAGMPNNSWRAASFSTTVGLTVTGPVLSGTTSAVWTLTAMTVSSGTLTVAMRYKDNAGTVISIGSTIVGFTEVQAGTTGKTAYFNQSPLIINQNSDGTFPAATQNLIFFIRTDATTVVSRTQPITVGSTGFITFGTPTGDASITVTTSGGGTRFGTVTFAQASSGISSTGVVQVLLLPPFNNTFIVYRRSLQTAPEALLPTPTGGVIDTATGFLSTTPVDWTAAIPSGTNVLYQSQITITYQPFTGLLPITGAWSSVNQSNQLLASGARYIWGLLNSTYVAVIATGIVYFRQTGTSAPVTPTGGSFSFNAGVATVTSPSGWASTIDNNNYDLKYSSSSTITTVSDTQLYTPTWSSPLFIYNPVGQVANQYIFRTGAQPATVPNPTAAELLTVFVRNNPRFGDAVVVQYSSPLTYVSFTYNGVAWIQAASFIKGDMVVTGTITATQIAAATITGDRIAASTITADRLTVTSLSAITANMGTLTAGTIQVGTSPAISGTTMTGSGALLNPSGGIAGRFALGNAQTNIVYDGSAIYLNGPIIASGNLQANSITTTAITAGSVIASKVTIDGFNIIANGDALKVGSVYQTQVLNTTGTVTYSGNLVTSNITPIAYTNIITWTSVPNAAGSVTISITFESTDTGGGSQGTMRVIGDYTGTSANFSAAFTQTRVVTLTATRNVPIPTTMQIQVILTGGNNSRVNGACAVVFNQVTSPSPTTKAIAATNTYP